MHSVDFSDSNTGATQGIGEAPFYGPKQLVRVYDVNTHTPYDVFSVDARELVASGAYSYTSS